MPYSTIQHFTFNKQAPGHIRATNTFQNVLSNINAKSHKITRNES